MIAIGLFTDRRTYTLKRINMDQLYDVCREFFTDDMDDYLKRTESFESTIIDENRKNKKYNIIPQYICCHNSLDRYTSGKFIVFMSESVGDQEYVFDFDLKEANNFIEELKDMEDFFYFTEYGEHCTE